LQCIEQFGMSVFVLQCAWMHLVGCRELVSIYEY
jgi:hypothetical protein